MDLERILVAMLLFLAGSFGAVHADTCVGSPPPAGSSPQVFVSYPAGGSISISYQLCYPTSTSFGTSYWTGTMTYDKANFDGSAQISGAVDVQVNWSNNVIRSITLNGGPLTYVEDGQSHVMWLKNLMYTFNSSFQPVIAWGTLTVDGFTYRADLAHWSRLFR